MAKGLPGFVFITLMFLPLLGCSTPTNIDPVSTAAKPPTSTRTPSDTPLPTYTSTEALDPDICYIVTPTPSSETWFSKMCVAQGLEILSSENVSDVALEWAHKVVVWVFKSRPELLDALLDQNARLVIYDDDSDEATLIPGLTVSIATPTNKGVFDPDAKLIVTWDEDLLCKEDLTEGWSQYTIHEIAHAVYHIVIEQTPKSSETPAYNATVVAAYDTSSQNWLAKGTSEYFAESVTAYFGVYYNPTWIPGLVLNDQISQGDLQKYEPEITKLIAQIFGEVQGTQPGCPSLTPNVTPE